MSLLGPSGKIKNWNNLKVETDKNNNGNNRKTFGFTIDVAECFHCEELAWEEESLVLFLSFVAASNLCWLFV